MFQNRVRLISYIVIAISVVVTIVVLSGTCSREQSEELTTLERVERPSEYLYGISVDSMEVIRGQVASGSTFSTLVSKYGLNGQQIDRLVKASEGVFDLRGLREGKDYAVLVSKDTLATPQFFVYEHSIKDYVIFSLSDSAYVKMEHKPVEVKRRRLEASITSSLWGAIAETGVSYLLSEKLESVFQWTVDFYGVQSGDSFNVIYDEEFVDGKSTGIGTIYGAWFVASGKRFVVVRYEFDDKVGYWDENGKSAKKAFLKAPLNFSRISSRFSPSRMHPVLRVRRPHLGVDYAAPSGTPVRAISDGVVTMRSWGGGGGNTIKIKHARGYVSGYLHLRGYAKGLTVGKRVAQGEVIGYVGSTGLSTGPHLDFRIWKNGTAIDPLKLGQEPGIPLPDNQLPAFGKARDRILSELEGGEYIAPEASVKADSLLSIPTL